MAENARYDYIIIGGGSAGCTLANRLTEDASASVLLLEAGGWDRDPWIHMPLGLGRIFPNRLHDWMYFTQPDPTAAGREIECARGKVIGGSSSVNALAYVRGHPSDYDGWAARGLQGWSYREVLPYFRRAETWDGAPSPYRGTNGPLSVRRSRYAKMEPLIPAILQAARQAGHQLPEDFNGASQEGFSITQQTIRNGRRCSAATAYLRPALRRANLRVEVNALVNRIVIEGRRAMGVAYSRNGSRHLALAAREVLLCGGAFNSPQILMLSGIGPAGHLSRLGIAPGLDLPGVGRNLQDHVSFLPRFSRKTTSTFQKTMRYDRLIRALAAAYLFGEGVASELPFGATAFVKSEPAVERPDLQFLFLAAPFPTHPYLAPFIPSGPDGFACRIAVLRPKSRGTVEMTSADPADPVRINTAYLSEEDDMRLLRKGLDRLREVITQPALRPFVAGEVAPGCQASKAEIDDYIRSTTVTVHHPACTCRMGLASDPTAVVDAELLVHGMENLRVVDGSVIPDLVGGNTNAPIIMIAEKAADMILGRPPLRDIVDEAG